MSVNITVRPIIIHEVPLLIQLNKMAFPDMIYNEDYYYILQKDFPSLCLIAFYEDKPVGYMISKIDHVPCYYNTVLGRLGYIVNIGVLPEYRGKGISKILIESSIVQLKAMEASEIYLHTNAFNFSAQNVYTKCGFDKKFIVKNYFFHTGDDAIIYTKNLRS